MITTALVMSSTKSPFSGINATIHTYAHKYHLCYPPTLCYKNSNVYIVLHKIHLSHCVFAQPSVHSSVCHPAYLCDDMRVRVIAH